MSKIESFTCNLPQRLDTFLVEALSVSRNQVALLIKSESIQIDNKLCKKPGVKLKENQVVQITFPEAKEKPALKIDFDVEVLFEDDDILVINKPSGLTVHPAPSVKEATLVDWLKHKGIRLSTISGEERHGIVHRLDKGTSGVMVVAKSNEAHTALSEQLQDKSMGRYYLAAIDIALKDEHLYMDKPIARSSANRLKMAVAKHGKNAQTLFKKLMLSDDERTEFITCKLFTGRTHQIRVHLESVDRHILGDHLYSVKSKNDKISRILLHAYILYFNHPTTNERVTFVAPLSDELEENYTKYFDKELLHEALTPSRFDNYFINPDI